MKSIFGHRDFKLIHCAISKGKLNNEEFYFVPFSITNIDALSLNETRTLHCI